MDSELVERELCYSIVGAFFEVYNYFGCGLSESVYSGAMECALTDRGHRVAREVVVEVRFKGRHVGWQRLDMIVDGRVIVENKATERLPAFAEQQITSYLRASPIKVGLILHLGPRAEYKRYVDTRKRPFVSIPSNSRRGDPPHSRNSPHSRPTAPSPSGETDPEPG